MKMKTFFANFQILVPLGVRNGLFNLKMWKKSKSLHPTVQYLIMLLAQLFRVQPVRQCNIQSD